MAAAFDGWRPTHRVATGPCLPVAAGGAGGQPVCEPEDHLTAAQRRPSPSEHPMDPQISSHHDR